MLKFNEDSIRIIHQEALFKYNNVTKIFILVNLYLESIIRFLVKDLSIAYFVLVLYSGASNIYVFPLASFSAKAM